MTFSTTASFDVEATSVEDAVEKADIIVNQMKTAAAKMTITAPYGVRFPDDKAPIKTKKETVEYSFSIDICGGCADGIHRILATSYDEADQIMSDTLAESFKHLPSGIEVEYSYELEETDANDVVESCVKEAIDRYSTDNIDIVRNEETNDIEIMYHSDKNSFAVYVIDGEAADDDDDLVNIANRLGCGYNLG